MKKNTIVSVAIAAFGCILIYGFLSNRFDLFEPSKTSEKTSDASQTDVQDDAFQRERFGGNRYMEAAKIIEEKYLEAEKQNQTFILAGTSEDKHTIYYFTASNEPQNALWGTDVSVYAYNTLSKQATLLKKFYGGVLDMYPEKNVALYMIIDPESLEETISLVALKTNEESIIYKKNLTESDGDIAEGPRISGMVYFDSAIINADGTKAVISTLGTKETQSEEFGAIALFNLMSGEIDPIEQFVGVASPKMWENLDTVIFSRFLENGDQETFSYSF